MGEVEGVIFHEEDEHWEDWVLPDRELVFMCQSASEHMGDPRLTLGCRSLVTCCLLCCERREWGGARTGLSVRLQNRRERVWGAHRQYAYNVVSSYKTNRRIPNSGHTHCALWAPTDR